MLEFKCSLLHMVKEIVISKNKVYVATGFYRSNEDEG